MAFGGAYLATTTNDQGSASWTVNVPNAGSYYVWCRILSNNSERDSFYAHANSGSEDVYDTAEQTWSPNWQWTILNGRNGTGVPLTLDPRMLTLSAGANTIVFRGRENATRLDRVIVTDDPNFVPTEGDVVTFSDTPPSNPFYLFVETLASNDVSSGCGSGKYCPASSVTRAQMAVFLLKSKYGSDYTPPAATGQVFSDVPKTAFAADWIEQLSREGITAGCGGGKFCPGYSVTRAQMAVFLLRAEYGADYAPPPATGVFHDIPISDPFTPWIEQLAEEGVTAGCGNGNFCPNSPNTRGQMAAFLVRAFGLS